LLQAKTKQLLPKENHKKLFDHLDVSKKIPPITKPAMNKAIPGKP